MEKLITIEGREIKFVANGGTPRLYRSFFKKDVFGDMARAITSDGTIADVEVIENLAFIMAKQGGLEGYSVDEWLGSFDSPMAIMTAAGEIFELWLGTNETVAAGKKK